MRKGTVILLLLLLFILYVFVAAIGVVALKTYAGIEVPAGDFLLGLFGSLATIRIWMKLENSGFIKGD